jgi:hypothetical protein
MANSSLPLWQKPLIKKLLKFFAFFAAVVLLFAIAWHQIQQAHFRQFLPKEFQNFPLVSAYDSLKISDLPALMFIRESFGCAIFKMTPEWVEKFNHEGLNALQPIRESKGNPDSPQLYGPRPYTEWKETPIPKEWVGSETLSGAWLGLDRSPYKLQVKIMSQLNEPGSFYTELNGDQCLLIIPKLKWVIFTYSS